MASGLYKFSSSLSRKITPCIKKSTFHSLSSLKLCRNLTSFAFNTGLAEETFPIDKSQASITKPNYAKRSVLSLKEKEKGDWRNLTIDEKRALYRMSFSQPFTDLAEEQPADDWKIILAATFTAMGFMTLGMYVWLSQKAKCTDLFDGPISLKEVTEDDKKNIRSLMNKESD